MPVIAKKATESKTKPTQSPIQKKKVATTTKKDTKASTTTDKTTTTTTTEDARPKLTQGQKLLKTMTAQKAAKKALMKGVSNTRVSFDEDGNAANVETVVKKIEPAVPAKANKSRPAMKKPDAKKRKIEDISKDEAKTEKKEEKPATENKKPPKKAKKPKKSKIEIETLKKDTKQEEALAYVRLFVTDRDSWKFKKVQQIWLLSNLYEIPEDEFDNVLEYLKDLQGSAREKARKEAEEKIPNKTKSEPAAPSHTLTGYANVGGGNDFDDFDAEKLLAQATTAPVSDPAVTESDGEENEDEDETLEIKRAKLIVSVLG